VGLTDLELAVESEGLHHEDEVQPMFRAFVDDASEESHALADYLFLLVNDLPDELDQPAKLVGFGGVDLIGLHHSSDSIQNCTVSLHSL
jgi:hypothetical protein